MPASIWTSEELKAIYDKLDDIANAIGNGAGGNKPKWKKVTPSITDTTEVDLTTIAAVGEFYVLTDLLITNKSEVDTWVNVLETDNIIVNTIYSGLASSLGGFVSNLSTGIRCTLPRAKFQVVCETTGAEVRCTASGYIDTV